MRNLIPRQAVAAGLTLLLSLLAAGHAGAQAYPNKPIRMVVPFPPGGGNDVIARIVAQKLGTRLGQTVVVDNRAGANGIVGLAAVKQAAPDGYTLGIAAAGPMAVNPSLYDKLPYDPVKDFEPITNMVIYPLLLVAHPSVPAKSMRELLELARAKPGSLNFASPGSGNSGHLAGELLNSLAKVNTTHVPYKGQGPAVSDLLAGQVQLLYSSIPSVLPLVQQGKLHALAVGSAQRLSSLPDVPTIAESGVPGYEAYSWIGIVAPAQTPRAIVERLNREIVAILKQKDVEQDLLGQGAIPVGDTPEHFGGYIKTEMAKWGAVVKSANIKAE
ncbi:MULTISPECIES: Bug family tripartite tricarboxylate transporter substrate binding protein [Ramlibacter]|uniref:Tripartite tricarboxylate transporter substrate binding protein n=1 Tax=Ramlibacter pinisoli TaxID=2682844 RepID=A0A6N8J231_9BURK|nr:MULTISPECIES: tripartite tricarboxylate transporter substrate binding protein [Ramlibacter]MBA2962304.1 tripartite tricarboxylate transporter substrate binding protein [Ramlibacter sp. CGMCC 1.13660]MVQ32246.1 tripartite tricarboxylate transporter substrate binding protein [Ramlibacter pinisoli]